MFLISFLEITLLQKTHKKLDTVALLCTRHYLFFFEASLRRLEKLCQDFLSQPHHLLHPILLRICLVFRICFHFQTSLVTSM